uniref:Amidase domain-containing protein n=1 Tax=Daphnia galeata TaxID=27404 RepID=A0A8J2WCH4_9CRUS|nr:unnamed protein product [Daphnia galeata]
MWVKYVLNSVFHGFRFIISNNPFLRMNWYIGIFQSSTRMLKVSVGICVIYITFRVFSDRRKKHLVKRTISIKLKEVCRNKGRLEQDLVSVNQSNHCEDLEISLLLQNLQDGHLSCLEVLRAYQAKALKITTEYNCITEFILEAEEWAKQLDADASLGGKKGPLHGLPFSVKDNVGIIGYDSTIGISKFISQPATEDAAIVIALKRLGAIPFFLVLVLNSFGCSNPIWGLTMNPWDKERTPGGSTGGEACLIAAGGSPMGAESVVTLEAVYVFLQLFVEYTRLSRPPQESVAPVPGIMARDSKTVVTITKLLLHDNHLQIHGDPDLLPIPWNEKMFSEKKKLKIGYYEDDGFFPTTPGIRRAIQIAKSKLEASGHELVPFLPPRVDYVLNSFINILTADQSRYLLEALSNDDIDPVLKPTLFALSVPIFLKRLLRPLLSLFSARLMPVYLGLGGNRIRETHQLWDEITKKNLYKEEFLSYWRELELDLCIAPCFACPAPRSVDVAKLSPALSYTSLYNFLDFPVGILPIDKENVEDQTKLEIEYKYFDAVCKLVKMTTKGATGMPLAIQMIGLPYQEEMVLCGMEALDAALRQ